MGRWRAVALALSGLMSAPAIVFGGASSALNECSGLGAYRAAYVAAGVDFETRAGTHGEVYSKPQEAMTAADFQLIAEDTASFADALEEIDAPDWMDANQAAQVQLFRDYSSYALDAEASPTGAQLRWEGILTDDRLAVQALGDAALMRCPAWQGALDEINQRMATPEAEA